MLGVSRTTTREALRQLEAEGLLELAPNKRLVVANLDHHEAANVYAVRRELEGFACAQCAQRATPRDIAELTQCFATMTEALNEDSFSRLQRAVTAFYDRLYKAAGNTELTNILQRLRARVTLIRGLEINRTARMHETVEGARSILAALTSGDPVAARNAAEQHIARAAKFAADAILAVDSNRKRNLAVGDSSR